MRIPHLFPGRDEMFIEDRQGDVAQWTFALSSGDQGLVTTGYAAVASASISTVAISGLSGPGWELGEIRSCQRVRRSSAMASAKAGVCLVGYQGWVAMVGLAPLWARYQSHTVPWSQNDRWAARSGPSPFQVWG